MKELPGGGTTKEHLENVEEKTGRTPPELTPPQVDDEMLYLLDLYLDIRSTASPSFDGSVSVRVRTILEYQTAYRITLRPWEIDVMIDIDSIYTEVNK